MSTIRISKEAYTKFMEIMGLMQYRKREKVSQTKVFDKILELVPESWRRLRPGEEGEFTELKIEVPDNCTICDEPFSSKEKKGIFPYPIKQWLCFDCFTGAMDTGLGRLNKTLRGEKLKEEDFKPHSRSSSRTQDQTSPTEAT